MSGGATQAVIDVLERLEQEEPALSPQLRAIRERVEGPLRVAIAGRVKAGKSTLLNALVGERLAPTDAGECTRLVSWYRKGATYEVSARRNDGQDQTLAFRRSDGALDIELGGLSENEVAWLDVRWPSSALDQVTLIDTPGLASLNDENSRRTRDFLDSDSDGGSDADAVIYLMRHVHKDDVAFLDAFMDRSVAAASPVNAVAVLSRADEIGAGRLDAMDSAARIAQRYEADPQVRSLCANVTPLAGLLAETGLTLREEEVANLRTLAATDPEVLERMLLSTTSSSTSAPARSPWRSDATCSTGSACTGCGSLSASWPPAPRPPRSSGPVWWSSLASGACGPSSPSTSCPAPACCRRAPRSPPSDSWPAG